MPAAPSDSKGARAKILRAEFPHRIDIATRWSDFDMLRHLNNVQYYRYFEFIVIDYLTRGGSNLLADRIIPLVVESGCNFIRPILPADSITAGLRAGDIGNSSVRYEIALFETQHAAAAARGYFTHVYFDRETKKTAPIPAAVRAHINPIAA